MSIEPPKGSEKKTKPKVTKAYLCDLFGALFLAGGFTHENVWASLALTIPGLMLGCYGLRTTLQNFHYTKKIAIGWAILLAVIISAVWSVVHFKPQPVQARPEFTFYVRSEEKLDDLISLTNAMRADLHQKAYYARSNSLPVLIFPKRVGQTNIALEFTVQNRGNTVADGITFAVQFSGHWSSVRDENWSPIVAADRPTVTNLPAWLEGIDIDFMSGAAYTKNLHINAGIGLPIAPLILSLNSTDKTIGGSIVINIRTKTTPPELYQFLTVFSDSTLKDTPKAIWRTGSLNEGKLTVKLPSEWLEKK